MRRAVLLVALCLLLAGCAALAPGDPGAETSTTETIGEPADSANESVDTDTTQYTDGLSLPEDRTNPTNATIGWYNGYWYDDPVTVNTTGGLNGTERDAVAARSKARVEVIRGLPFEEHVSIDVISREEFRDRQPDSGETTTLDEIRYEAMFIIGGERSVAEQRERTHGQTVGGFYSVGRGSIVLVSETDTPRVDVETLAHELTHALQDQHFDLSGTMAAETHDQSQARLGLIEGDANAVMYAYGDRCGAFWSCIEYPDEDDAGGNQPDIHMGLYLDSFFPYSSGPSFVETLRDGSDWTAVNRAYDAPPNASREIITPGEYGTFAPADVTIEDRDTGEWVRVRQPGRPDHEVVGRAGMSVMFAYTVYHDENPTMLVAPMDLLNMADDDIDRTNPLNYDLEMTQGWAGDRLQAYERGDETAYVWHIAWDSTDDADRFVDAYTELLEYWGGQQTADGSWAFDDGSEFTGNLQVTTDGNTVTIVNAPTHDSLSAVAPM